MSETKTDTPTDTRPHLSDLIASSGLTMTATNTGENGMDWAKLDDFNRVEHRVELNETGRHERFPVELGIPLELAYLIDHFFELLPAKASQAWPRAVLAAIPVGADLSGVLPVLLQWAIVDTTYGWAAYAKTAAQRALVAEFAALVALDWRDETVSDATWDELSRRLDEIPEWARAWAGARAWARAWAWAWAEGEWYVAASAEAIRLLKATGGTR